MFQEINSGFARNSTLVQIPRKLVIEIDFLGNLRCAFDFFVTRLPALHDCFWEGEDRRKKIKWGREIPAVLESFGVHNTCITKINV